MTDQELIEAILGLLEIMEATLDSIDALFSWPVVAVVLAFMFREQIEEAIRALTRRVRRISLPGANAEFDSATEELPPRLREATRSKAIGSVVYESDDSEESETLQETDDDDSHEGETEVSELQEQIENLRK